MKQAEKEQKHNKPLDELVLDTNIDRYRLVGLASKWVEELKQKEEYKYFSTPELIEVALKDILADKVSIEEIEKLPPREKKKVVKHEQRTTKERAK